MNGFRDYLPSVFPTNVSSMFNLIDEMNNIFSHASIKKSFPYPINIYSIVNKEKDTLVSTVIEIALAGFDKSEINVTAIKNKTLTVSLNPKEEVESEKDENYKKFLIKGISKRNATITWELASNIDFTDFKPTFVNGILKIVLPTDSAKEEDVQIIGNIE